ncbi:MAG: hypothetical protein HY676_01945 [Chloroflexi bacterium]|nr:hypothetical protein [Chloroflexota bacterium]
MYQGVVDFFTGLSSRNAPLYGLLVVLTVALASLALHSFYALLFRLGSRLRRL